MVEKPKSSKNKNMAVAVAVGGYIAYKIGSAIYNAWNSSGSSETNAVESDAKGKKPAVPEERKNEEYKLDRNVDIDSVTCPITCQIIKEPATTVYGHLFEEKAIREWVK